MHAAPFILKYLARVVIQDAAGGMYNMHPDHDVHVLLNTSAVFRCVSSDAEPACPHHLVHHHMLGPAAVSQHHVMLRTLVDAYKL